MAYPFGGHPTLGEYLAWVRSVDCAVHEKTLTINGEPMRVVQIKSPDSTRWVTEVGTADSDYLLPSTIHRLDRRLRIRSPYFSINPETGETP